MSQYLLPSCCCVHAVNSRLHVLQLQKGGEAAPMRLGRVKEVNFQRAGIWGDAA
jgi:hypothetical protein